MSVVSGIAPTDSTVSSTPSEVIPQEQSVDPPIVSLGDPVDMAVPQTIPADLATLANQALGPLPTSAHPESDLSAPPSEPVGPDLSALSSVPASVPAAVPVSVSNTTLNPAASLSVSQPNSTASRSLVDLLVSQGHLTPDQANQLSLEHIQTGKNSDALLEEKKFVSEEALTKAKAEFYNIPYVNLSEIGISPEALTQLAEGVARRYSILPFALNKQERTLSVAMKDPLDLGAIDFAEQKSGYRIVPHYVMPSELDRTLAERYAQSLSTEVTEALKDTTQVVESKAKAQDLSLLAGDVVRQAPISKIVETILAFAVQARASDIHIEPQLNRTRVRYRIDGILTEKLILPKSVQDAVVSRVKILSDLKIDEKRIPQDGRFNFANAGEEVDLRVSTLPTIHGEKIVMRLLKKDASVPTMPELGLRDLALRNLQDAIKIPHGIILVTGPTGSGKTTTLYSVLHQINTPKVNIVTLEDPVEYQMAGINQVQINPQAGLTFASGLRSFLRQDPNIIMVGEIRDTETVELAIQASLTGHLVFSTLHTSSAAGAVPRLLDMGAERFLLASTLTLTMAQRIVRQINPDYKEEYTPDEAVIENIKTVLGARFETWCQQNNKDPKNIKLFRSKEDRPQTEPEYKGRIGIYEVMPISETLSKMIFDRASASDLEKQALTEGMLLMKQDGYLKALEGITTIEEVLRVAQV
jgi:type IV pilus assembly protein PilB